MLYYQTHASSSWPLPLRRPDSRTKRPETGPAKPGERTDAVRCEQGASAAPATPPLCLTACAAARPAHRRRFVASVTLPATCRRPPGCRGSRGRFPAAAWGPSTGTRAKAIPLNRPGCVYRSSTCSANGSVSTTRLLSSLTWPVAGPLGRGPARRDANPLGAGLGVMIAL